MRQLFLILVGMGTGQTLGAATIDGSIRAWIGFGFLVLGMIFYFTDRYKEDKRLDDILQRIQK